MEFLEQNGALVPIPDEIVSQGRDAVAAWCAEQVAPQGAPPPIASPRAAPAAAPVISPIPPSRPASGEEL